MSRTWKDSTQYSNTNGSSRRISVRAVRRDPPDTRRLARALIAFVMAQDETAAAAPSDQLPAAKDLTNPQAKKPTEPND